MKTRIVVYGILALLLTVGLVYVAVEKQKPTGLATGYKIDATRSYVGTYSEVSTQPEYRAPAEFDKMQGLIICWLWESRFLGVNAEIYRPIFAEIVREAKTETMVYIVVDQGRAVLNYLVENNVVNPAVREDSSLLKDENIYMVGYQNVPEKVWVRDYGPFWREEAGEIDILDLGYVSIGGASPDCPYADRFPWRFLNYFEDPLISGGPDISEYEEVPVLLDGGNFMSNGDGLIICADEIIEHNCSSVDDYTEEELIDFIQDKFGGRLITLNKGDTGLHIDLSCKFINNNTVLLGQGTPEASYYGELEDNVEVLRGIDNRGKSLRVVRIPLPPNESGVGEPYSYLNSLIINKKILVPTYGIPGDEEALAIYRDQMPGYEIIGIDCSILREQTTGGVIHCLTREIPAPRDPKAPRALWPAGKTYDKQPIFQWAKAPGVLDYQIRIKQGDRIVIDEEVFLCIGEESSYELNTQELSSGIYTWKVGAIHQVTIRSGYEITFTKWSDPLTFKVVQYAYDKYGDELLDKRAEPITSQEIMKKEQKFYQPQTAPISGVKDYQYSTDDGGEDDSGSSESDFSGPTSTP